MSRHVNDLPTPALVVDIHALDTNLAAMAAALPGTRLRPHVKAHKCTALAARQAVYGHATFTCATPREVIGMARAGLGADLLLANETVNAARLQAMAALQSHAQITVAVDSESTIRAAAANGIGNVLVDVDIGLPRCGCLPTDAGRLAELARANGLNVRGVMGYEGHLMMVANRAEKKAKVDAAVDLLLAAHADVGGDIISSGGTGTYDLHDRVNEVQAGSYVMMDSQYTTLGHPFRQALYVQAQVIAVGRGWAVADCGLKAMGMDHGAPTIDGNKVWFVSDEHVTFSPADGAALPDVGDFVRVTPSHIDPTIAYHDRLHLIDGDEVIDDWAVDLRGW